MKKFKKSLSLLVSLFATLAFVFTGCADGSDGGSSGNSNTVNNNNSTEKTDDSGSVDSSVAETLASSSGSTFTWNGYEFTLVSGSAGTNAAGELVVTSPSEGIAVKLSEAQTTSLASTYSSSTGFYVEAVVIPTTAGSGSNKNFGPAGLISSDSASFSYAGVNFNGRTQLGELPNKPKGTQFGSLMSDSSYLMVGKNWTDFYTIRYEYSEGKIYGYINGIQFNKSGTTSYTLAEDLSAYTSLAGIYTNGDTFVMQSFKIGALDTGKAAVKLQSDSSKFITLSENATAYIFESNPALTVRNGSSAVTYTVTALDDTGAEESWTVVSSDSSILAVETSDSSFTVTPAGQGNATVTVKNASETASRVITYTVEASATYSDTAYSSLTVSPAVAATGVYEDDHLELTFDSTPSLTTDGIIEIYDVDNLEGDAVDTITIGAEKDTINGTTYTLKNFMVQVIGNTVFVKPHKGALSNGKTYSIGIPDGAITGTIDGTTFTGFDPTAKRWTFTTRDAYTPSSTSAITVGTSDSADYRTVQAALEAAADGAVITVEKGIYREIVNYSATKSITIEGDTTTTYGTDVVIQGINCNTYNGSSDTRAAFRWKGNDLTLKNITLQNAYDRNVDGTAQSEALYFNSSAHLVAYNSSFLGYQDTLLTKGKNWFYKCYVEGDTDFIWGYADVALFEECKIVQLNTSADTVPTSGSYIFETRVGSDAASSTTVGKGYVLFNCELVSNHPKSYLARRASASGSSGSNYYDQSAFINVTESGSGLIGAFGGSNTPVYIEKDSDSNMNVGVKYYGGNLDSSLFDAAYEGTMTEAVYNAEYSGRAVILNRVYKKTGKYVNDSSIWDYSAYETEFNAAVDTSELEEETTVSGANGTYDICALAESATGAASYSQNTALTDGTSDDGYVTWKNLLWHSGSSSYGVVTNKTAGSESVITVYVAGASVVTWTGSTYSNGTVTVTDANGNTIVNAVSTKTATDKTSEGFIYTGTEATTLTLKFSAASTYINNLVVSALDDETDSVSAVTVSGSGTVAVDETVELSATVTAAYLSTDTSVTWSSSDTSIATVDSDGVVTGIAAGTVTITATSVATSSVYGEKSVKVSADANSPIYGYTYSYTLTGGVGTPYSSDDGFLTVTANSDNGSHGLVMKDGNTIVLKVAGAGTISLLRCQYDKSATITLTNSEGSVIETKEALAATSACGDATDFTYSGEADTLTFTYSAGTGGHYLHGVKFTPSETTTTYTLTGGVGTPYSSDDGLLTVTANSDNGSHGLVMKDGNTIVLKVAGAGTISLLRCQYDKSATITLTNSEGTVIETKEALAATSACGDATDFTYSGEADTLTFTYSAGTGGHYLHGVTVAY